MIELSYLQRLLGSRRRSRRQEGLGTFYRPLHYRLERIQLMIRLERGLHHQS